MLNPLLRGKSVDSGDNRTDHDYSIHQGIVVLFVVNTHQEGDQGSSRGKGFHDKERIQVGQCGAPYTRGTVPMDLILIGGGPMYKEPPAISDRLQQLGADCFVDKTTHRFAFGDNVCQVILETSNIVAVVGVLTITHKGHSDLIISDGDVVDSGGSDLHFKE